MVKDEYDKIYMFEGQLFFNVFMLIDVIVYFNCILVNKLEFWFWMELDWLLNFVFCEFYVECDVVYEECWLCIELMLIGEFDEQFNVMFWQLYFYSWLMIGWFFDLCVISKEQVDDFFCIYYVLNNIIVVFVGNFEIDEVKLFVECYFGCFLCGLEVLDVVIFEMEQKVEKCLVVECDCQLQIEICYYIEFFVNQKSYLFDVLVGVFFGWIGCFYKFMVEGSEVVSWVFVGYLLIKFVGYFLFNVEIKGDLIFVQFEVVWDVVVVDFQENFISEEEFCKVKNCEIVDIYCCFQDLFFFLIQLVFYEGQGDYCYFDKIQFNIELVMLEQICEVVCMYFVFECCFVGYYFCKFGIQVEEILFELMDVLFEQCQVILVQFCQFCFFGDVEQLKVIVGQIEGQVDQVLLEMRLVVDLMICIVKERFVEFEGDGGEE